MPKDVKSKTVAKVMWRLFQAYFFYPIMIGLFLWLYFTDAHWIFGLAVILATLVLDRTWYHLARNAWRLMSKK